MENIQTFSNAQFGKLRTVMINDDVWFVGKDVAEALGYSNTRDALSKHVDNDDKNTVAIHDGIQGNPNQTIINESGVYSLVFGSKLPTAKAFKHWVTSEVLPTIRKHGAYMTDETLAKVLTSPDFGIRLLTALKEEREKSARQAAELEAARPKIVFADAVSASDSCILIGGLAKLLRQNGVSIGQNRLFAWLREHGWLIKGGTDKNMPSQKAMNMGLFKVKEGSYIDGNGVNQLTRTTKVTARGQQYFVNKFLGEKAKA